MQIAEKLMKQKNVQLINRDFTKKHFKIVKKFDYVTCLGTINLFNEIESIFSTMFKLCKKNGKIFIYDIFNDDPVNIRSSINFDDDNNKKWYSQFNCFSQSHVKKICKKINPKSNILFQELIFTNINVKKKKFPSLNSYTKKIDKKTFFISPYKQILPFKILEITNN
jgi:ubiquinone/menaquinone biosynthesis C-methylase UbiE